MRRQPYYVEQGYDRVSNPISDELSATVLSIPMHPYLSESDKSTVVDSVRSFFV
jgi:dTDP-4-amino-4,6-dideoxygalactose transaminase